MQQEPANPAESSPDAPAAPAAEPLTEPATETPAAAPEPPAPPPELLAEAEPETEAGAPVEVPFALAPHESPAKPELFEAAAGTLYAETGLQPPTQSATNWEGWVTADSQMWVRQPAAITYPEPEPEVEATAEEAPAEAAEPVVETGPNWMLAFVCAWAGATSLNEAAVFFASRGLRLADMLRNQAFTGYILLGLGLLGFGIEALRWGRRRGVLLVLVPALLTLAGIVLLVLSPEQGRRI